MNGVFADEPFGAQSASPDCSLVERAVWVALVDPHWIEFVSARVRNDQADPSLGLIADQISLR